MIRLIEIFILLQQMVTNFKSEKITTPTTKKSKASATISNKTVQASTESKPKPPDTTAKRNSKINDFFI